MREYCDYHIHSYDSNVFFLDSPVSKEDYAKRAVELGHTILSSCEHGYAGNFLHTYDVASKYGLKFIFAAELYWVKDRFAEFTVNDKIQRDRKNNHIVLIAKNKKGMRQINALISEANDTGYYFRPRADLSLIMSLDPNDVMVTTACLAFFGYGFPESEKIILDMWRHFGDSFYLEIQAHDSDRQRDVNKFILSLYRKYGIKVIAGVDSHFITPDQAQTRLDLQGSTLRALDEDGEGTFYMDYPDGDTLYKRFVDQGVIPEAVIEEALRNTLVVKEFEDLTFDKTRKIPNPYRLDHPEYTEKQRTEMYLELIRNSWREFRKHVPKERWKEYTDAIQYELDTMIGGGVSDYALLDWRIVQRGIEKGGVVSRSGRGSGPSFFTNTLLGFSTMDRVSLPVKMFPDRFVSKPRLLAGQLPDLDLNVADRAPFIEAQKEIVGEGHAYPMIAFSSAKKKNAWKMYCRSHNTSLKDGEESIDVETMNAISDQLSRYDTAVKYAEDDEEVDIEDYIAPEYMELYKKSESFWGITVGKTVHPCAILVYDGNIREEIGLIRAKSDSGKLDELVTVIDGVTADKYGYVKNDILKVSVYDLIDSVYKEIGKPIPTTNELLEMIDGDEATWNVFAKGTCCGVNQCEKAATKERLMRYKPQNISELSAFVAAIRPGFKSNLETFLNREPFEYGIPEFDSIIQTPQMHNSFLLYQENIMSALSFVGFELTECYATLKHISKKQPEEIEKIRPRFISGFIEKVGGDKAKENAELVWQIISDASSYSFNASHSTAVAFDALYIAWAKAHYPLETHKAMLEIYSKKGDKARLAQIKSEMYSGFGIKIEPCHYGRNNTRYNINRETNAISDCLVSIPYINKTVARELANNPPQFDTWIDLLIWLTENTSLNSRQMKVLIRLGYFSDYGNTENLMTVYTEFKDGKNKYSPSYAPATKLKRIDALKHLEFSLVNTPQDIYELIQNEVDILGIPVSIFEEVDPHVYVITEIDDAYSAKITLYSIPRGTRGTLKMRKREYLGSELQVGDIVRVLPSHWSRKPKRIYSGGSKPAVVPGVFEKWMLLPEVIRKAPLKEIEKEKAA